MTQKDKDEIEEVIKGGKHFEGSSSIRIGPVTYRDEETARQALLDKARGGGDYSKVDAKDPWLGGTPDAEPNTPTAEELASLPTPYPSERQMAEETEQARDDQLIGLIVSDDLDARRSWELAQEHGVSSTDFINALEVAKPSYLVREDVRGVADDAPDRPDDDPIDVYGPSSDLRTPARTYIERFIESVDESGVDYVDFEGESLTPGEVVARVNRGEPVYTLVIEDTLDDYDVSDAAPPSVSDSVYEQDVVGGEIDAPEINTRGGTSLGDMAVQDWLDRERQRLAILHQIGGDLPESAAFDDAQAAENQQKVLERQRRILAQFGADAPELFGEEQAELQSRMRAQSDADSFIADERGEWRNQSQYVALLDALNADETRAMINGINPRDLRASVHLSTLDAYLRAGLPKKELRDQADSLAEQVGLSRNEVQSVIDGELSAEGVGAHYLRGDNQFLHRVKKLEAIIANYILDNVGETSLTRYQRGLTHLGTQDAVLTLAPPLVGTVGGIAGGPIGAAGGFIATDAALRELFGREDLSPHELAAYAAIPYAIGPTGQVLRQIPNVGRGVSRANPFGITRDLRFADFGPYLPRGLTSPRLTTTTAPRTATTTQSGITIVESPPPAIGNLALNNPPITRGITLLDDWLPPGATLRQTPRGITIVEAPPLITTSPTVPIIVPPPLPDLPPLEPGPSEPQTLPPDSPFYDPGKDPADPDIYIEPDVLPDTRPETPYVAPDKPPYIDPGHLPGPDPGDDPYTEPEPDSSPDSSPDSPPDAAPTISRSETQT